MNYINTILTDMTFIFLRREAIPFLVTAAGASQVAYSNTYKIQSFHSDLGICTWSFMEEMNYVLLTLKKIQIRHWDPHDGPWRDPSPCSNTLGSFPSGFEERHNCRRKWATVVCTSYSCLQGKVRKWKGYYTDSPRELRHCVKIALKVKSGYCFPFREKNPLKGSEEASKEDTVGFYFRFSSKCLSTPFTWRL